MLKQNKSIKLNQIHKVDSKRRTDDSIRQSVPINAGQYVEFYHQQSEATFRFELGFELDYGGRYGALPK